MAAPSAATRLAAFFALNQNTSLLLAALVAMGFAEELWMRFLPKYLASLGATVWAIGIFDAIKTWIGAIYAYPGGLITDRWGLRKALCLFTLLSVAGYVCLLASPSWRGVLLSAFLFLSWTSFSLPATFSLVGSSLAANQHAMGLGVQATLKRIPIVLGPVAGGVLIDRLGIISGLRLGVVVALVLGIVTMGIQWRIRDRPSFQSAAARLSFWRLARSFSPTLRRLLLSDILVRICERIPYAWVILYAMDKLGLTATQFGVLTAIETTTAMACLIPAAYLSDRYGREPFVIATFVFFTLFPISLLAAHDFQGLCAAFVIRGLKEFGEAARKSLIIRLSPEPRRGQIIGTYYLIRDCLATAAAFVGAALWAISPNANFIGAAAAGAAGTLIYAWTARRTLPAG